MSRTIRDLSRSMAVAIAASCRRRLQVATSPGNRRIAELALEAMQHDLAMIRITRAFESRVRAIGYDSGDHHQAAYMHDIRAHARARNELLDRLSKLRARRDGRVAA